MAGDTDLTWLPTEAARIAEMNRLAAEYPALTVADAAAVDVLYVEAKNAYETARDRLKALDGKAATLMGVVTTGLGAIAILGDPAKIPARGTWIVLALATLAVAFVLALLAHAPRGMDSPKLNGYALQATLAVADNAVRMKYDLTLAWLRDQSTAMKATLVKGNLLTAATLFLAVGLAALALNFLLAPEPEKQAPAIRVMIVPTPSQAPQR